MLDIWVVRILSILFVVGAIIRFGMLALFSRKRQDLGSVKASKPTGFVLHQVWLFLDILLPLIFYLLGATVPGWVYGTLLNLSFNGAEVLQVVSVPLFLSGVVLVGTAYQAIGQLLGRGGIEVMEKHELVTRGPYSRIRHPILTSILLMVLACTLLFLHIVLVVVFLVCVGIAYRKAVLEEELLSSEEGFGQEYRDYMLKTGRFLPKLTNLSSVNAQSVQEMSSSKEKRDKHFPLFVHDNPFRRLFSSPDEFNLYFSEGQTVADLGCGPGYYTLALAEHVGSKGRVYAVDSDEKAIGALKKKADKLGCHNIEFYTASVRDLSFIKDESVDFILANGLLCSSAPQQHELAVNEMKRILKLGGKAYLSASKGFHSYMSKEEWEKILEKFRVEQRGGDGSVDFADRWALVSKID
jgi:protein-S-isoprenylcysteine O-methyltransferase Ste14/16S rRNA G527 N7-methylase RsmG